MRTKEELIKFRLDCMDDIENAKLSQRDAIQSLHESVTIEVLIDIRDQLAELVKFKRGGQ